MTSPQQQPAAALGRSPPHRAKTTTPRTTISRTATHKPRNRWSSTAATGVDDVQAWEQQRRPELLEAFQEHVYGQSLPDPEKITFDDSGGRSAKTVTITVTGAGSASFTLRLFVPDSGTPRGTFLLIDHRGSVGDDAGSSSGYAPTAKILDAAALRRR